MTTSLDLLLTADPAGLTQLEKLVAELRGVLQGNSGSSQATEKLRRELATLKVQAEAARSAVAQLETNAAKLKTTANLASASLSKMAQLGLGTLRSELSRTKALLLEEQAAVEGLNAVTRAQARNTQAEAGVLSAYNQVFRESVAIKTRMLTASDPYLLTLRQESLALANLSASQGVMTREEVSALAVKSGLASAYKSTAVTAEALAVADTALATGLANIAKSGQLANIVLKGKAKVAATLVPQINALAAADEALAAGMTAATTVGEREAIVLNAVARAKAQNLAATRALAEAEALAVADTALATGLEDLRRRGILAGIVAKGKATVAATMNTAAVAENTAATEANLLAQSALKGAVRGTAGAMGMLWLSYGSLLPLMTAYVAVATNIKGIKLAAEFEYTTKYIDTISKSTGDFALSLSGLRERLLSIQGTAHNVNELSAATKELVKQGFPASQALAEMGTLSKLATLAEEDLTSVTKDVVAQYRAWNAEAVGASRGVKSLTEVANILSAVAMRSATTIGGLTGMLSKTTELSLISGARFTELSAAMGYIANLGVRPERAATSLRMAITKLQNPTAKATKLLQESNIAFDAFTASGRKKSITELFSSLEQSLRGLTERKQVQVLSELFSLRSLTGGTALIRNFIKQLNEGTISFSELVKIADEAQRSLTFLDTAFEGISETVRVQAQMLKSDVTRELVKAFSSDSFLELIKTLRTAVNDGTFAAVAEGFALITTNLARIASFAVKVSPLLFLLKQIEELRKKSSDSRTGATGSWGPGHGATGSWGPDESTIAPEPLTSSKYDRQEALRMTSEYLKQRAQVISTAGQRELQYTQELAAQKIITEKQQIDMSAQVRSRDFEAQRQTISAEIEKLRNELRNKLAEPATAGEAAEKQRTAVDNLTLALERQKDAWADLNSAETSAIRVDQMKKAALDLADAELQRGRAVETLKAKLDARAVSEKDYYAFADTTAQQTIRTQIAYLQKYAGAGVDTSAAIKKLNEALAHLVELQDLAGTARRNAIDDQLRSIGDTADDARSQLSDFYQTAGMLSAEADLTKTISGLRRASDRRIRDLSLIPGNEEIIAKQRETTDQLVSIAKEEYDARRALQENWKAGAVMGLRQYQEEARDVFTSTQELVSDAMKGMSDAIVEFVSTGKSSFADLARSLVADLLRIQTQKIAAGIYGSLFGSFGASSDISNLITTSGLFHRGGMVGAGGDRRNVPTALFAGAPRLHNGLAPDEYPAILQRGERVIPKSQAQATPSGAAPEIRIINALDPSIVKQYLTSADGVKAIMNVISKNSAQLQRAS